MDKKSRLIDLIERASAAERALLARLPEEERAAQGELDHWAPKDILAHLADWNERLAANMAAVTRGESPQTYPDYLEWNDRGFLEHREEPWPVILERAAAVCRQLIEQVEQRSEAELHDVGPWPGIQPLWQRIAGTGYIHSIQMHLSPLCWSAGRTRRRQRCARKRPGYLRSWTTVRPGRV